MRTSSWLIAAALLALLETTAQAGSGGRYASPQAAFELGLGAYKSGQYEVAVPALEEAAAKGSQSNRFFAEFYLARIYSDAIGAQTDHAKAYMLFQKLADENVDADPDEGHRAPFVAKALTALAGYLRKGVAELGLQPDEERAIEYLQNAATSFGDHEAQFELAKIYLARGGPNDIKLGKHFLSVPAKEGFAPAQAFLADLYWSGRYVRKDEQRALALITVAVENAPPHESIWIEDIYLNVYCGIAKGARQQASDLIAVWQKMFARPAAAVDQMGLGVRGAQPQRTCRNGEIVEIHRSSTPTSEPAAAVAARPTSDRAGILKGSAAGIGLRDVGAAK